MAGEQYRVFRNNIKYYSNHPTEERRLEPGDIIIVDNILDNYPFFDLNGVKFLATCIFYKRDAYLDTTIGCIPLDDCILVTNDSNVDTECTCPSLLFGHHPGCIFSTQK